MCRKQTTEQVTPVPLSQTMTFFREVIYEDTWNNPPMMLGDP
jgi:hypothetical protein